MRRAASWPDEAHRLPPAVYGPADTPSRSVQTRRILIVEDDYFVALELEHLLLQAGYEVIGIAGTAADAIETARSRKPDLAIVDIRLAGAQDGVDAAMEMFSKLGIRSIFASAHGNEAMRRRAEAANPLGWLQKPYSAASLLSMLRSALTS